MSNVAKLKKQAADLELKKQFDKALAVYVKLLESFDQYPGELDVALFNRVGDLMLRQGNVADAVDYYEQAVERYADTGFFNNAIALCNKILRHSPGRASVYYKLGKISAHKGFKSDAKANFLEYADRMRKAGNVNEAFRALTEFADLCPDQHEIRLMLADQLTKADRKQEAIDQLQTLYARYETEGRSADAAATVELMRAIDPNVEPRTGGGRRKSTTSDLIFLDLDSPPPRHTDELPVVPAAPAPAPASRRPTSPVSRPVEPLVTPSSVTPPSGTLAGITRIGDDAGDVGSTPAASLAGLESTRLADEELLRATPGASLAGLELTALAEDTPAPPAESDDSNPLEGLPLMELDVEGLDLDDDEPITIPTPSVARKSTLVAVESMEHLRASVAADPDNWALRRELAEAMLEAGERSGGIKELEMAMTGADRSGDLALAAALAEEIARLEPDQVRHHQKRVEYAFRTNDRARLIDAYLALADALLRSEQSDKARTVYQRVIELAPDERRARTALDGLLGAQPALEPAPPARGTAACTAASPAEAPADAPVRASAAPVSETFVNLGDWLRDEEAPRDTRMIVDEQEPSGDEDADFADMLRKFKQGVAENVDPEDYQSHYDLAIAYKEMGLLDEAIAEFQKALGSPTNRVPTYEALGQCFLDKRQFVLASSILSRALHERASEEQLVGVLYLLGLAAEAQGNADEALVYYQRVFVLDIQFRDIAARMSEVERRGVAR